MTPRFFVAAFAALLPVAALAQAPPFETIEVNGNALVGVWKIDFPTSGQVNMFGRVSWGPMQGNFCRVEQSDRGLTANCFPYPGQDGTVSLDGAHFHMAWGSMMARIYLDGSMPSPASFEGHNGIKISGMALENPTLSRGEKLVLSPAAPDLGGDGEFLKRLLEQARQNPAAIKIRGKSGFIQPPPAAILESVGALETVTFLGALPRPEPPNSKNAVQPDYLHVYDVEFAAGHRICGLHHGNDGVIEAFRCV
jgi:hypothetical protein